MGILLAIIGTVLTLLVMLGVIIGLTSRLHDLFLARQMAADLEHVETEKQIKTQITVTHITHLGVIATLGYGIYAMWAVAL